ncbi:uncharacterized protein LOC133806545 [Humulus lupulus]|uniref:uncharacterized protein LOC133806545 n=1 Tax=Humulus lupulus TaxID=3486 RepID=UPI002B415B4F|nr:uncharacterized protein LOC133806545 [Humulus lupulus]
MRIQTVMKSANVVIDDLAEYSHEEEIDRFIDVQQRKGIPDLTKDRSEATTTANGVSDTDFVEALSDESWINVMQEEIDQFTRNEVFVSGVIMVVSTSKQEIEKFDDSNDSSHWIMKMTALLNNLSLNEALLGEARMPTTYSEENKKEMMKKAYNTFILSLSDKVLREVSKMKTAAEIWL